MPALRVDALAFVCLAVLPLVAACDTSGALARVPAIGPDDAVALVRDDLAALGRAPSAVAWARAYRHFDRHVEPHLGADRRLALEVAFADLRRAVKAGSAPEVARRCAQLADDLQPQD